MQIDLSNIISISGMPGLYEVAGQTHSGIIAKSIQDGKKVPVYASYQVSALEDISIFSDDEDVPLKDVFEKIHKKENGKEAISHKSSGKELEAYFEKVMPEYDKDRVYTSNIKKVIQWYNLLVKHDLFKEEEKKESGKEKGEKEKSKKTKDKREKGKSPSSKKSTAGKKSGSKKSSSKSKTSGKKGGSKAKTKTKK